MARGDDLPSAAELHGRLAEVVDLPRSLTGPGVVRTLELLGGDIAQVGVPSGTPVLDWEVPEEWTLRRATLRGPDGAVVADSDVHPLHVLGYSESVDVHLELDELQAHLHSDPAQPDVIPYRTSYYRRQWGFCLPDAVRRQLVPGTYHAVVDADLGPGRMVYGERVVPGDDDTEVVVVSHVCHPGMANDNASGNVVAAALADHLAGWPGRRRTWRFLWVPGTIGEITWLATNRSRLHHVEGGLVLAGVGDAGDLTYKRSRRGDGVVDRAAELALAGRSHRTLPYSPWGYAERQFNSLGFDIPVGRLSRTEHGTYPEYHTSADDLAFVSGEQLRDTLVVAADIARTVDGNATYRNTKPHGEPRLGPRGLYPSTGGRHAQVEQLALLWVLSESDGRTDLVDVARRAGAVDPDVTFDAVAQAAAQLAGTDLLEEVGGA